MTNLVDRNPQGRDTGAGFVDEVEEKSVQELLVELIDEVRKLRFAMVLADTAVDLEDQEHDT